MPSRPPALVPPELLAPDLVAALLLTLAVLLALARPRWLDALGRRLMAALRRPLRPRTWALALAAAALLGQALVAAWIGAR